LDPDESPGFSSSHPDPSCLHMAFLINLARKMRFSNEARDGLWKVYAGHVALDAGLSDESTTDVGGTT